MPWSKKSVEMQGRRTGAVVAASNASVYTRRVLVGGCRPQTPERTGAVAPVLTGGLGAEATNKHAPVYTGALLAATWATEKMP